MIEQIREDLAKLDNAIAGREVFVKKKQDLMNSVLTDEIKQQLKDIEDEFSVDVEHFDEYITDIKAKIKEDSLVHGESVKGEHMKVTWVKGRVTWDSKGLEGYAIANPLILKFRKQGNPSIRFGNV